MQNSGSGQACAVSYGYTYHDDTFEAIAIPLYSLCHQLNMLNTKSALILPAVANGTYIFLFKNAFEEIPDSLAESARIDGASWLAVFTKIYIPLTKPIMVSAGLLIFFYQWQSFVWPLIAANAPEVRVVQVALSVFQQENGTLWGDICSFRGHHGAAVNVLLSAAEIL